MEDVLDWCGVLASAVDVVESNSDRENLSRMLLRGWSVNVLPVDVGISFVEGMKLAIVIISALSDSSIFVSSVPTGVGLEISPVGNPIGVAVGNTSGLRVITLLLIDATSDLDGVAGFMTVNALSDPGTLVSSVVMAVNVDVSSTLTPVRLKAGIAELPQSHCGCSVQFPDS